MNVIYIYIYIYRSVHQTAQSHPNQPKSPVKWSNRTVLQVVVNRTKLCMWAHTHLFFILNIY